MMGLVLVTNDKLIRRGPGSVHQGYWWGRAQCGGYDGCVVGPGRQASPTCHQSYLYSRPFSWRPIAPVRGTYRGPPPRVGRTSV